MEVCGTVAAIYFPGLRISSVRESSLKGEITFTNQEVPTNFLQAKSMAVSLTESRLRREVMNFMRTCFDKQLMIYCFILDGVVCYGYGSYHSCFLIPTQRQPRPAISRYFLPVFVSHQLFVSNVSLQISPSI